MCTPCLHKDLIKTSFLFRVVLPFLFLCGENAFAQTYYVDDSASNDKGNGSIISPKRYITSGISLLNGGDTLIIKDGIYTGLNNMIGDYAQPRVFPPSGLGPLQYTTIKAENIGGAIIDAEYNQYAFSNFNSSKINFLKIEGIHFRHGKGGVFNLMGDYNKVLKSGFEDGMAADVNTESPIAMIAGGSSNTLVEDCWVWGKGRYGFYTNSTAGGTSNIVLRRVVIRLDDAPDRWVCAGTRFYRGDTNSAQNVVVIDSEPTACSYYEGAFAMGGGSSDGEPNHSYNGIIALNNKNWVGFFPDKSQQNTSIDNALLWGNDGNGLNVVPRSTGTISLNHVTVGKNGVNGFRSRNNYSVDVNVTNSISYGNTKNGFTEINLIDKVNVYGNGNVACDGCTITNEVTTDPLSIVVDYSNPAIKYLLQIENDSNLKGVATDGGDIGGTILHRIGAPESLYGDEGWDQTTADNLWPWPDENIWIPKMRAYTASGSGGNRGFAADDQTLTNYIWGYFNYDGDPDTPSVTVPLFNIKAMPGDKNVTLTWDLPALIAISSISEYRVYNVTGIDKPSIPGAIDPIMIVRDNTSFSTTVNGLKNDTSYDFVVTAVDTIKGEGSYSYIVSGTPIATNLKQPKPPTGVSVY